jgi:A/G-specific adenine glycosylase
MEAKDSFAGDDHQPPIENSRYYIDDAVAELLIAWYEEHARDLPWRRDRTPYHVWLSEVMLQQTRIETVIPYYERFLAVLPTIRALADCAEDRLLKLWEGLGYYSRVRNLHKAAQVIAESFDGEFPDTYDAIRQLPGIGDYTAGAIASICFGLPRPAVDGNVLRVCARVLALRESVDEPNIKRSIHAALTRIYPDAAIGSSETNLSGLLTEALMELGETVCIPNGVPLCAVCPLGHLCRARAQDCAAELPVRAVKREKREADVTVFILHCAGKYAIRKRPGTGLLAGMWEFPNTEEKLSEGQARNHVATWGLKPVSMKEGIRHAHVFTHIRWHMRSFIVECEVTDLTGAPANFVWVTPEELRRDYALPTAFRKFVPR